MGASFNSRTYDFEKLSLEEVKEEWNDDVEESLYEDGHNYSGGIGMLGKGFELVPLIAKTEEEADEYICENHQKWDGAMAMATEDGKIVIGGWCSE